MLVIAYRYNVPLARMTEVWFRNPYNYVRELVECNTTLFTWDRGLLVKRQIDPMKFVQLYYGKHAPFRALLIGEQGSAEIGPGRGVDNPVAVYPTWKCTEDLELLEEMMAHPVGEDPDCYTADVPIDEKPVQGQEHRVVVTELPDSRTGAGRAVFKKLKELQEDYPECILHIHGSYSFRIMFGMGYGSADVDPRFIAAKGRVILPAGKEMIAERTIGCPQWVTLLGFNVVDLKVPRNRTMYNIKSAQWAGEHFMENIKFKSTGTSKVDPTSKDYTPATTVLYRSNPTLKMTTGDKQLCNTCSLQLSCKYFRQGSVCSVPGSEPAGLARMFKTRDSQVIIDGLGQLLASQAHRLEQGMRDESEFGELDPEVTKMANQVFGNGVKLAKLIDPTLTKPQVQVNVGQQAQVGAATPNQIMGSIVRELESRGIPRDKITPQMVQNLLIEMGGGGQQSEATQQAIEARVVSGQGGDE